MVQNRLFQQRFSNGYTMSISWIWTIKFAYLFINSHWIRWVYIWLEFQIYRLSKRISIFSPLSKTRKRKNPFIKGILHVVRNGPSTGLTNARLYKPANNLLQNWTILSTDYVNFAIVYGCIYANTEYAASKYGCLLLISTFFFFFK